MNDAQRSITAAWVVVGGLIVLRHAWLPVATAWAKKPVGGSGNAGSGSTGR